MRYTGFILGVNGGLMTDTSSPEEAEYEPLNITCSQSTEKAFFLLHFTKMSQNPKHLKYQNLLLLLVLNGN